MYREYGFSEKPENNDLEFQSIKQLLTKRPEKIKNPPMLSNTASLGLRSPSWIASNKKVLLMRASDKFYLAVLLLNPLL